MNENRSCQPRAPIPILSYHQTDTVPPRGVPYRELVLPPRRFGRQMRALSRMGYRGLSLRDLEPYLRGERAGKVVGITLDDGYRSNFEHALPVLRSLGFTATSFVVSAQVGGSNVWDQAAGIPPRRLMDQAQLKAWIGAGMEVGAHTRNHVDLLACDSLSAHAEIAQSRSDLERLLGVPVRSFCYPYGRAREEHIEMARAAGFLSGTTCESGRVLGQTDPLALPRITVWLSTPLPLLLARALTGLEEWRRMLGRLRRGGAIGAGAASGGVPVTRTSTMSMRSGGPPAAQ